MVRELFQLNTLHKKVIVALIGAVLTLVTMYGILVRQTVAHVVARKVVEQSITDMASEVSLLEAEYMDTMDSLTLSRAEQMGFVEAEVALFVSRRTLTYTRADGTE